MSGVFYRPTTLRWCEMALETTGGQVESLIIRAAQHLCFEGESAALAFLRKQGLDEGETALIMQAAKFYTRKK